MCQGAQITPLNLVQKMRFVAIKFFIKAAAPSPLWVFQHNENRSDRSSVIQRNLHPVACNGESSESSNTTNTAAAAAASAAIQCNRHPQTRAMESSSMSPPSIIWISQHHQHCSSSCHLHCRHGLFAVNNCPWYSNPPFPRSIQVPVCHHWSRMMSTRMMATTNNTYVPSQRCGEISWTN